MTNQPGGPEAEPELTILMPCLNEAETVSACVADALGYLGRSGIKGEVLVADNGSRDGSVALAQGAGARVVHVSHQGYGAALMEGIREARGRFVVMGDADRSYDFSRLDPFVERLRSGVDLVVGNRFRGGIADGAMPFLHRWLGNPVLSFIGRLFFSIPIGDFHCGLRGFNRHRMLDIGLISPGMEFASEMIVRSALAGHRIEEVPTTLAVDGRSRGPHLNTWRDGWRHLRFLLLFSPRWLFLYPGVISLAFGLALTLALLPGPLSILPGFGIDVHTMIVGCLAILVGVQCISFAVLARRHAAARGFLTRGPAMLGFITLERTLVFSALMFLAGVGGVLYCVEIWREAGFGSLEYGGLVRILTVSTTTIAVAVQTGFSGFLLAILEVE